MHRPTNNLEKLHTFENIAATTQNLHRCGQMMQTDLFVRQTQTLSCRYSHFNKVISVPSGSASAYTRRPLYFSHSKKICISVSSNYTYLLHVFLLLTKCCSDLYVQFSSVFSFSFHFRNLPLYSVIHQVNTASASQLAESYFSYLWVFLEVGGQQVSALPPPTDAECVSEIYSI